MRCIVSYDHPKRLLRVFVHGAPHRRECRETFKRYRENLWAAAQAAGISEPLTHDINLSATFIDPNTPDLDNLICGLFRAMDSKSAKGQKCVLKDDRQVIYVKDCGILYP